MIPRLYYHQLGFRFLKYFIKHFDLPNKSLLRPKTCNEQKNKNYVHDLNELKHPTIIKVKEEIKPAQQHQYCSTKPITEL